MVAVPKPSLRWLPVVLCALLVAAPSHSATINEVCEVVGISDGDTFTARCSAGQVRVRFQGIDAPESKQAFGNVARQYLAQLVFRQNVRIVQTKATRSYDRVVANVFDSTGADVGLKMIQGGLAWHYKQFSKEQTLSDRLKYASAEATARNEKIGLWFDANPTPPWDFRRK